MRAGRPKGTTKPDAKQTLSVRISPKGRRAVEMLAKQRGVSISVMVDTLAVKAAEQQARQMYA